MLIPVGTDTATPRESTGLQRGPARPGERYVQARLVDSSRNTPGRAERRRVGVISREIARSRRSPEPVRATRSASGSPTATTRNGNRCRSTFRWCRVGTMARSRFQSSTPSLLPGRRPRQTRCVRPRLCLRMSVAGRGRSEERLQAHPARADHRSVRVPVSSATGIRQSDRETLYTIPSTG